MFIYSKESEALIDITNRSISTVEDQNGRWAISIQDTVRAFREDILWLKPVYESQKRADEVLESIVIAITMNRPVYTLPEE